MQDLLSSTSRKRIKDLPTTQRPMEKLIAKGRENVSNADLIAILLNTGTAKQNALTIANNLQKKFPVTTLPTITLKQLIATPGIGKTKALRILAAIELGYRLFAPQQLIKQKVTTTREALMQLSHIADKKQEHIMVIYLNARDEVIQKETLAIGTLNSAILEPKDIFAPAFITPCASIIIAHNHPSGNPTPSEDDINFTSRIHEASKILGITLLDHIILSHTNYYSFRDNLTKEITRV